MKKKKLYRNIAMISVGMIFIMAIYSALKDEHIISCVIIILAIVFGVFVAIYFGDEGESKQLK